MQVRKKIRDMAMGRLQERHRVLAWYCKSCGSGAAPEQARATKLQVVRSCMHKMWQSASPHVLSKTCPFGKSEACDVAQQETIDRKSCGRSLVDYVVLALHFMRCRPSYKVQASRGEICSRSAVAGETGLSLLIHRTRGRER